MNNMQRYRVLSDFETQDDTELSVEAGEMVCFDGNVDSVDKTGEWVRVYIEGDAQRHGVVPLANLCPVAVDDVDGVPGDYHDSGSLPKLNSGAKVEGGQRAVSSLSQSERADMAHDSSADPTDSTAAGERLASAPVSGIVVAHEGPSETPVIATARVISSTDAIGTAVAPAVVSSPTTVVHSKNARSGEDQNPQVLTGKLVQMQGRVVPILTTTTTAAAAAASTHSPKTTAHTGAQQTQFSKYPTARLSDVQLKLQQIRDARQGNTLMSRYLLSNSVQQQPRGEGVQGGAQQHVDSQQSQRFFRTLARNDAARLRFKNKQIYRRKLVLLGYQEVGKTSLRKCFESEPYFFRRLPDVKTTTGVEVHEKCVSVDGGRIELTISDFAGQESYHSHTFFLTSRSIFCLVWKISAVEQDFQNSGINAREEERLYKWITEVYAKFPRARILLIATHLDELRVQGQKSVEMILNKVERKIVSFLERISTGTPTNPIVGNFAVSCKTRQVIASGERLRHLSGSTISATLQYLAEVAMEDCMSDREYPSAVIPGRHAKLIEEVEHVKRQCPTKLLMPIGEFVLMALHLGIDSDSELLQVARLMHSWDIIYLLNTHRIEDNLFIMLHPRWLSLMSASLFSYAHILRTPLHLRSIIGGLQYLASVAESADMCMMRRGFLRWPLARVLFYRPLADFLLRVPDDSDISMCLELLKSMELLYEVRVPCDEMSILLEETPAEPEVGRPVIREQHIVRYFIPSLAPYNIPGNIKRLAPLLFHRGVRLRFEFNFLPDELWFRLQCKLHSRVQPITVHQPPDVMLDEAEEEQVLLDGSRLKEADDEHNRWKDAMWLQGMSCRVLVFRESFTAVSVFSAETQPGGSEEVLQALEEALAELLAEYEGVRRCMFVACPGAGCAGWLDTNLVATHVRVTCPTCSTEFSSDAVIQRSAREGASEGSEGRFSEPQLEELGSLLSFCLSYRSSLFMCHYLGVPYRGTPPKTERDSREPSPETLPGEEVHVEYLHALDKVVQAVLFSAWVERLEERERRRRMLEAEPSVASGLFR